MAKFKIGDNVILGDHFIDGYMRNWGENMASYVGRKAKILADAGVRLIEVRRGAYGEAPLKIQAWYVDLDRRTCYWFETNMKLAIEYPDQKCSECEESAPHCEPNLPDNKYICSFCKVLKEL